MGRFAPVTWRGRGCQGPGVPRFGAGRTEESRVDGDREDITVGWERGIGAERWRSGKPGGVG